MKKYIFYTLTTTLIGASGLASAENRPYLAFHLGINSLGDQTIDSVDTGFGPQPGGYIASNVGEAYGFAVGWDWDFGLRAELELSRSRNKFTRATAGALSDAKTKGHGVYESVFFNLYYDFPSPKECTSCWIHPYVGTGVGKTWSKWKNVATYNANERVEHDSRDSGVTAQIMLGAAYDLPQVEGLLFTTEVRYVKILKHLSYDGDVVESRFGSFPIKTNLDEDTDRFEILIGLRYNL